jgi:hypothetical protein
MPLDGHLVMQLAEEAVEWSEDRMKATGPMPAGCLVSTHLASCSQPRFTRLLMRRDPVHATARPIYIGLLSFSRVDRGSRQARMREVRSLSHSASGCLVELEA